MAAIVAKRLFEHLEQAGFVVMKRPPMVPTRKTPQAVTVSA